MKLSDLTKEERVVLIGLLKVVVQADKKFTPEELEELNKIADLMGAEKWQDAMAVAQGQFMTKDDMRAAAKFVERQPARELIFKTLCAMAGADVVAFKEEEELAWLARLWQIEEMPQI